MFPGWNRDDRDAGASAQAWVRLL